jgi:alpha-glucosidase
MKRAFFDHIRFWLDLGVDGFRLDVVNMIVKDSLLRNNPLLSRTKVYNRNRPETYDILRDFRSLLDEYPEKTSVGEIYVLPPGDPDLVASFLGNDDMLHMAFDFSLLFCTWNARKYYRAIQSYYDALPPAGWPCFAFSNHDMGRSVKRFGRERHTSGKARLLAVLLLTLKGVPFIYYGDEIGMTNVHIPYRQINDQYGKMFWPLYNGRDPGRTPMQWDAGTAGGFTSGEPWLPLHKNYQHVNTENEAADENSVLNVYRRLIALRKEMTVLQQGGIEFTETGNNGILSYTRILGDQQIQVILNFSPRKRTIPGMPEDDELIFSTHRNSIDEGSKLVLQPFEAMVISLSLSPNNHNKILTIR